MRESSFEKLVPELRKQVKTWRDSGYAKATETSRSLLNEDIPPSPDDDDTMDYFLGKRPTGATTDSKEDLDVPLKMARLRQWCGDINRVQTGIKYGFVFVDQEGFEKYRPRSFRELAGAFAEHQTGEST